MADDPNLWSRIFSDQNLILGFFGALRAFTLRTTWREGLRVVFIGGATAFGTGILAPSLLKPYFGEVVTDGQIGTISAASFLLGLIAVTLVERALDKRKEDK